MRNSTKNIDVRRRRGRPRKYDPETALLRALETFWAGGYAATTLAGLSAATGMNRPRLYGAFRGKERRARAGEARQALEATVGSAIDLVCGPERKPRRRRR